MIVAPEEVESDPIEPRQDSGEKGTADELRYVLGIDLGTTNSVLAYAPLDDDEPQSSC